MINVSKSAAWMKLRGCSPAQFYVHGFPPKLQVQHMTSNLVSVIGFFFNHRLGTRVRYWQRFHSRRVPPLPDDFPDSKNAIYRI